MAKEELDMEWKAREKAETMTAEMVMEREMGEKKKEEKKMDVAKDDRRRGLDVRIVKASPTQLPHGLLPT